MDIFRLDQTLSLPKGISLRSKSGRHVARKVCSNVSDGIEWWSVSGAANDDDSGTVCPLEVEDHWTLMV